MNETMLSGLLKERNMTIRQFADAAGVPYATLYDVVIGKRELGNMSARHVAAIARALNTSIDGLLQNKPPELSAAESELIAAFRSLSPIGRRVLLNVAEQLQKEMNENE